MRKILSTARGVLGLVAQGRGRVDPSDQSGNAFEFEFDAIDGLLLPLGVYRGKALLIVNTASLCGFTPQFAGLEDLWKTYRDKGLVVLGVPSNDFGGQEPKNAGEIQTFCKSRFGVSFPLMKKYHVTGKDAHPFYQWAQSITGAKGAPRWNFHKYLIGRDGHLAAYFPAKTSPSSTSLKTAIEAELEKAAA